MTLLVDPPRWPAHGRLWSHLVSDVSLAELHGFAARVGVPARAFEGDHYDVPAERVADVVAAGALPVSGRELLQRLVASGLRVPKRRGQRILASWVEEGRDGRRHTVDLLSSHLAPPAGTTRGVRALAQDGDRLLLRRDHHGWALPTVPGGRGGAAALLGFSRRRPHGPDGTVATAGQWRHLLLVRADADQLSTGVGATELAWWPRQEAADRCGNPAWWPLVDHALCA